MSGGWLSKLFVFHPYRLLAGAVVDFVKCTGFLPMCSRLLEFANLFAQRILFPKTLCSLITMAGNFCLSGWRDHIFQPSEQTTTVAASRNE
jgi:hypothetical protein